MASSSARTSATVTSSRTVSMRAKTLTRSTTRPPGPPTATSTPGRSSAAVRSRIASTVSMKGGSAGSPAMSARTYRVVRSGETRGEPGSAASGARTWMTLSGAPGPVSQPARPAAAAKLGGLSPSGSRRTMSTGVPGRREPLPRELVGAGRFGVGGEEERGLVLPHVAEARQLRDQQPRDDQPNDQRDPLARADCWRSR